MAPQAFLARVSDQHSVYVATGDADTPIGFIELQDGGHIDCFYCRPDVAGTGVGAALYAHLEDIAQAREIRELTVEASEAARRFFERQGFVTRQRQQIQRSGVSLHNYVMKKTL